MKALSLTLLICFLVGIILAQANTSGNNEDERQRRREKLKNERERLQELEDSIDRMNERSRQKREHEHGHRGQQTTKGNSEGQKEDTKADQKDKEEKRKEKLRDFAKKLNELRKKMQEKADSEKQAEIDPKIKQQFEEVLKEMQKDWQEVLDAVNKQIEKLQEGETPDKKQIEEIKEKLKEERKKFLERVQTQKILFNKSQDNVSEKSGEERLAELTKKANKGLQELFKKIAEINLKRGENSVELRKCLIGYKSNFNHLLASADAGVNRDADPAKNLINASSQCQKSQEILRFPIKQCFDGMLHDTASMIAFLQEIKKREQLNEDYTKDQGLLTNFREIAETSFRNIGSTCAVILMDKALNPCEQGFNEQFEMMASTIEALERKTSNLSLEHVNFYLNQISQFWAIENLTKLNFICSLPYDMIEALERQGKEDGSELLNP